jgi:hypothetical protein
MPTHRLSYDKDGVTGREIEHLMDFYRPQSKREEEILEWARVCHSKDELIELEQLFRIERAGISTVNPDNAQSVIVAE